MQELKATRLLAVVTGAASGIGWQLAKIAAQEDYELVVADAEPIADLGAEVTTVQADLGTRAGLETLLAAIGERQVDALMANVGGGLDLPFLEQDLNEVLPPVQGRIDGTLRLVQHVARRMTQRVRGVGNGHILLTTAVAGSQSGNHQAVYSGGRAFIDAFALALRHELSSTRVTVTKVSAGPLADPAEVARQGFEAMRKGEAGVVATLKNQPPVYLMKKFFNSAQRSTHR